MNLTRQGIRRILPLLIPFGIITAPLAAQVRIAEPAVSLQESLPTRSDEPEDYGVFRDPPRLFLDDQRQLRIQREPQRQSLRWEAFDAVMTAGSEFPEPGFANALYYRTTSQAEYARAAIEWAMARAAAPAELPLGELRQLALVLDWLWSPFEEATPMTEAEADRIAARLESALEQLAADRTIRGQSVRGVLAVALADRLPDHGEGALRDIVQNWWRRELMPALTSGETSLPADEWYFFYELMYAVRDNLRIDLRSDAAAYFDLLPLDYLAGYYPPRFPGERNDFRIAAYLSDAPPDLRAAALARAAGLAMTGYDTNHLNTQFVQGWLMFDAFLMRNAFGAPYEYLWANPYQPGLSYQTLPLVFHSPETGRLFARTSWNEDAGWVGYFDGRLQVVGAGGVQTLPRNASVAPLRLGDATLASADPATAPAAARLAIESPALYILGLAPHSEYAVEIDHQELDFISTDAGGTLVLGVPPEVAAGVRVRRR